MLKSTYGWLFALPLGFAPAFAAEIDSSRLFRDLDRDADGQLVGDEVGQQRRLLFKRLVRMGDDDGDERLSAIEFAAALLPVRAEKELVEKIGSRLPGSDSLTVLLVRMDANGDQQLEEDEIAEGLQGAFEQMLRIGDGDKDGKLTQREIAKAAPRLSLMAQNAANRLGIDVAAELKNVPSDQAAAVEEISAYRGAGQILADPAQAAQLFRRFDADGDERLAADEAPEPLADRFAALLRRGDRDGDGRLNRQEFMAMSRRLAEFQAATPESQAVGRSVRQLLSRFDQNDDSQISRREAPRRMAENFDRADGDGNGFLDRTELARVAETISGAHRLMRDRQRRGDDRAAIASPDRGPQ